MNTAMIEIRKAITSDLDKLWEITHDVIRTGDTYIFDSHSSKEKMLAYWLGTDKHTYVALLDGEIVGTFNYQLYCLTKAYIMYRKL